MTRLNEKHLSYLYHLVEGVSVPLQITPEKIRLLRALPLKQGDICVVAHPRSGATWLTRIIILLFKQGEDDNGRTVKNTVISADTYLIDDLGSTNFEEFSSPRIFKMHLPYHQGLGGTPSQTPCKYIYVARNPKDVVVSYYFFEKAQNWWGGEPISWEIWLDMFLEGTSHRGPWIDNVLSWWKNSSANNILFITYEDLIKQFDTELERIAVFLNCPLTREVRQKIKEKTRLEYMKGDIFYIKDADLRYKDILRDGKVGSWRTMFTLEQNQKFDEWYAKKIVGSGLSFDFV